jgi:Tn7-like transposition protein D
MLTFYHRSILLYSALEHPCASDSHSLQKRYRVLLSQRGFLPTGRKIRINECLKAFLDYYPSTLLTALHCEIPPSRFEHDAWLFSVMHNRRSSQHPLRHILAIHFLGSSVETFCHLDIEPAHPFGEGPWPCLNPVCEHYRQRRITVCQIRYHRHNGCPIGGFACACGFTYSRTGPDHSTDDAFRMGKVLSYGQVWETILRNLWSNPTESLASISRRLGVAMATVKLQAVKLDLPFPRISTVSTVTGVKQKPKEEDVLRRREQWLAYLRDTPEGKENCSLRRNLPNVYVWLKKHDKAWLLAHQPPKRPRLRQRTPVFTPSIDEALLHEGVISQDARMAEAVRERAALIIAQDPPKRVTMNRISMDIPQILQLKNTPEKAPLTVQVLQEVIETWEAFAVRRIWRIVQKYQEKQVCPSRNRLIWSTNTQTYLHVPIVKQALDDAMLVLSQLA